MSPGESKEGYQLLSSPHLLSELTASSSPLGAQQGRGTRIKSNESAGRWRTFSGNQGNLDLAHGPAAPEKSKGHRMVHGIGCSPTGNPSV